MIKLLICASEAGSAVNFIPVIQKDHAGIVVSAYADAGGQSIFDHAGVQSVSCKGIRSEKDADHTLAKENPSVLLLGRSRSVSGAERFLTRAAKRRRLPVVSLVDDWQNYRLNFVDRHNKLTDLPDVIACPDDVAIREAIAEGIPDCLLKNTGSPGYAEYCSKVKLMLAARDEVPGLKIKSPSKRTVTFLSEVIKEDYSEDRGDHEKLDQHPGYDEFMVRDDLRKLFIQTDEPTILFEKLHPSAARDHYSNLSGDFLEWVIVQQAVLAELFLDSHLVLGMRSASLLKAALTGRPVCSYQPNLVGNDRCTASRLGYIPCVRTFAELRKWVESTRNVERRSLMQPQFARSTATDELINAIFAAVDGTP